MSLPIVLFEDTLAQQLAPVSLTRPTWAIRCASFRLVDWFVEHASSITSFVRPHLQAIQQCDWPEFADSVATDAGDVLMVNARLAPTVANMELFARFEKESSPALVSDGQSLIAAIVPAAMAASLSRDVETDRLAELKRLSSTEIKELSLEDYGFAMLGYPHDIVGAHMKGCGAAIEHRLNHGDYQEVQTGVFVVKSDQQTVIPPSSVFDTSEGPVVFESNVRIGPFCFFRGPVHVGENSKISEHSSIKDSVAIAHTCKMGGEIEGVQTDPWSNKQHFGFLGHSYIGSWINLGAGTCNSDLKNTYGIVNMVYGNEKVSTGMQFVGCVMGDYSRTAINTSMYTGKVIGVGSTVYGMTAHNVPSFVNCAQLLGQYGVLPVEVLTSIQKRMFGRRKVEQRPCDIQLIHDLFQMTASERDDSWSSDPIAF